MAYFNDTLRGDGLARAQRALAVLEGDPQRLDRARLRFDGSPPPYTSDRSGTTTRSQSLNPPSEKQRHRQERRMQLAGERQASMPNRQFKAQVEEERKRLWYTNPSTGWRDLTVADLYTFWEEARETVKKRWVEQGIWNSKWTYYTIGRWKHEEPLEPDSELETDSEAEPQPPSFSFAPKPQPKPRPTKSDDEKRWIAERRVVREREREASRPYHQFVYQISKERERIKDESVIGEDKDDVAADINATAYENIKNAWIKVGMWNKRWDIMPGMTWKHEEPFDEEAAYSPAPVAAGPPVNSSQEAGEALAICTFGSFSPVESNHRQASAASNSFQQGPSADIDSAGLENGNAERSPSAPNSPQIRTGKRVLVLRPSRKEEQLAIASLGPIHPSKVSKSAVKKRRGPHQQLNFSQNTSSDESPLASGVDTEELQPSPDRVTPRRSKRIHPPIPSEANIPTKTASTSPSKLAV